ncbi:MAG TPA: hypothetical protein VMI54_30845 [Polyangiaceae bacterium]|nr:hypothetical protein [Polyangiaceae bacterium]
MALAFDWVFLPFVCCLRHPLPLGEVVLLGGILLFAWLRSFGAPLQFLSEKRGTQFWAGFAATVCVEHAFLIVYLNEAHRGLRADVWTAWFVAVWGSVLARTAFVRHRSKRSAQAGQAGDATRSHAAGTYPKLTQPLRLVATDGERSELGPAVSVEVEPWPFLGGAALACCGAVAVYGAVHFGARFIDPELERVWPCWDPGAVDAGPRVVTPTLHVLAALVVGVVLLELALLRRAASAANALCSLLCLVTAVTGASNYWLGGAGPALVLIVVLSWIAGRELFAIRIADLASFYDRPPPYPPAAPLGEGPLPGDALLVDRLATSANALPGWPGNLGEKRPLILVCTSGGGIRAAAWTAGIMGRLSDGVRHFAELTPMVTGASGGMVGAAFWLAWQRERTNGRELGADRLLAAVTGEAITANSRTLVLNDIPAALRYVVNRRDRSTALESRWEANAQENMQCSLRVPLADFKASAARGELPSLVFSPVVVEDGRRLLFGNLRLPTVSQAEARWLSLAPGAAAGRSVASDSAYHASELFGASADDVTLLTAARLSASFPYVSPAAVLPTNPRRRVVDAGYYDDYGVDLATGWLREALEHHHEWLARHVSGILVIQIRDEPSALDPGAPDASGGSPLGRGLEGLTSPIQAVFAARDSSMRLRNDAALDAVMNAYERACGPNFVLTQVYELKRGLSLNWYLAGIEIERIGAQLRSQAITSKIDEVDAWVGAHLEAD